MDVIEEDIYKAIQCENNRFLEDFLSAGLDVNHAFVSCIDQKAHGLTLLQFAVHEGCFDAVRLLIKKKCDVNLVYKIIGFTLEQSRVRSDICQVRCNDRLHLTCLYRAICTGNTALTRLLVDGGADVNLHDKSQCTALWHAVDTNNNKIADIVISAEGGDVNSQDRLKIGPLHVAAIHKNPVILTSLLNHSAVVDLTQIQGATTLHFACQAGSLGIVKILLQHGANPNHRDYDVLTPLICAIDKGNSAIVYLLLYAGAFLHSPYLRYTAFSSILLKTDLQLRSFMLEDYQRPTSLKTLTALLIKDILKQKSHGRSIYETVGTLPLPRLLVDYLQLNRA